MCFVFWGRRLYGRGRRRDDRSYHCFDRKPVCRVRQPVFSEKARSSAVTCPRDARSQGRCEVVTSNVMCGWWGDLDGDVRQVRGIGQHGVGLNNGRQQAARLVRRTLNALPSPTTHHSESSSTLTGSDELRTNYLCVRRPSSQRSTMATRRSR